jgi:hypothetical protein
MGNEKKGILHLVAVPAFVAFIVLGLACASMPRFVPINIAQRYQGMLQQPAVGERVIDSIAVLGSAFECRDERHAVRRRLGDPYDVLEANRTERHRDELLLDQLLAEATRRYPNINVNLRNARIDGHHRTNARQERFTEHVRNAAGQMVPVERTRSVWDCQEIIITDVTTTEPMPQPITSTRNLSLEGQSRNDAYRRAHLYLDDFRHPFARVEIQTAAMDLGRIRATYIFNVNPGQVYIITAPFTIDVLDGSAQIQFRDLSLQRSERANPEQIFLQSIADLVETELAIFIDTMASNISVR